MSGAWLAMSNTFYLKMKQLPRVIKISFLMLMDLISIFGSVVFAFQLRLGDMLSAPYLAANYDLWTPIFLAILFAFPTFGYFGLYQIVLRYFSMTSALKVIVAWVFYATSYGAIITAIGIDFVPRSIGILQPFIFILFLILSRFFAKFVLLSIDLDRTKKQKRSSALIYGAGDSGRDLAQALNKNSKTFVVGFLDDDKTLQGRRVDGYLVYDPSKIEKFVKAQNINEVFIALPRIAKKQRSQIIDSIAGHGVAIRSLPKFSDIEQGLVTFSKARELSADDILMRDQVYPKPTLMKADIHEKEVMVSGAGGSIGGALCEQIISEKPFKLVLLEQNELALYNIMQRLESINSHGVPVVGLLCSIQNDKRINQIFAEHLPNTFYHAAAYKHVPIVEENLLQGIETNVFGTLVCAKAAMAYEVDKFVFVSTDKAVRPTNVMGASKRVAELLIQAIQKETKQTKYAIVRFGNVMDSSGSVVPKFRQQINDGGPVTLTHKKVTRYFMTILEASQLVIQAGAITGNMGSGSKVEEVPVYVLDMGRPVKIYDLVVRMIKLAGMTIRDNSEPNGDIEIKIVGLRPGEKLYEELLIDGEVQDTAHKKIKMIQEPFLVWTELETQLKKLQKAVEVNSERNIHTILEKLVSGYKK